MKFYWQAPKCPLTCKHHSFSIFYVHMHSLCFPRLVLHDDADDDDDKDLYVLNTFKHRPDWAKASMAVVTNAELGELNQ